MDYPLLACSCHRDDLANCESCLNNHEISIGLLCYNKKLMDRKRQQESKLEKLKKLDEAACFFEIEHRDSLVYETESFGGFENIK